MRVALAAVADHGDLAGEQAEVAVAVNVAISDILSSRRTSCGLMPCRSDERAQADAAGSTSSLIAVRPNELLERVELLGRADDLEDERLRPRSTTRAWKTSPSASSSARGRAAPRP